jgi:hypothetical protein
MGVERNLMLRFRVFWISLAFAILVGGCVVQPIVPETPEPSAPESATEEGDSAISADLPAISADLLSNLEYRVEVIGPEPIQLTDGHYEDVANRIVVDWINTYALGELGGEPAAAVILSSNMGGSGIFRTLAVVLVRDGALAQVADTLIGDRVLINSIHIEQDAIVVDLVTQGPDEPMCCGTQRTLVRYTLQDDALVATSTEVIGTQTSPNETEVITFTPQAIPAEARAGHCFANAISLDRADAWRCMTTDNLILDPCFQVDDVPTVVCGADPIDGDEGFVLELTEPLPAVEAVESDRPWLVQLGDGTICAQMTGTVPGVGDQIGAYGCADDAQSYLLAEFDTEFPLWFAQSVTFDLGDEGFSIRSSVMKPVAAVWR